MILNFFSEKIRHPANEIDEKKKKKPMYHKNSIHFSFRSDLKEPNKLAVDNIVFFLFVFTSCLSKQIRLGVSYESSA